MWLSLEDTYTVMDEHANSVEENIKEFKALLEPIYKCVPYHIIPYHAIPYLDYVGHITFF